MIFKKFTTISFIFLSVMFPLKMRGVGYNINTIDSLERFLIREKDDTNKIKILNALSWEFVQKNNLADGKKCAEKALFLANKLNYIRGIIDANNYIGIICKNESNYSNALEKHFLALKNSEAIGDKERIVNSLNGIGQVYWKQMNFPLALEVYFRGLKIVEKDRNKRWIGIILNNIGIVYEDKGDYGMALAFYFKSQKVFEEINDEKMMAYSLNQIGILYDYLGDYSKSLENYFKALTINEGYGDKYQLAWNHTNIGLIYHNQGNYAKALEHYFESLKVIKGIEGFEKDEVISRNLNNIGNAYQAQGLYFMALEQYNEALKLSDKLKDKMAVSTSLLNIGVIYDIQENLSMALEQYLKALKIKKEISDKEGIAITCLNIGVVKIMLKNFPEARCYLNDALSLSLKINHLDLIQESYHGLSTLDSSIGDYKHSLENYKKHVVYKDSLLNEEKIRNAERIVMRFEFEKKEALAKSEQDQSLILHREKTKKQEIIIYLLGAIAISFLIITSIIYYVMRREKKLRKNIEILQEELHHRVGNNLSIIQRLINVTKEKLKSKEMTFELDVLKNRVLSISETHEQLHQQKDTTEISIKEYFERLGHHIENTFHESDKNISLIIEENININILKAIPLGLIVNELITNCYKHACCQQGEGLIKVKVEKRPYGKLFLSVSDNGKGFPNGFDLEKDGFYGLKLVQGLAQQISATTNIVNKNGAYFELIMDYL